MSSKPEETGYRDHMGKFVPRSNITNQQAKVVATIQTLEEAYTPAELISYHLNRFIRLKLENTYCDDAKRHRFWEENRTFAPGPFVDQRTFSALLTLQIEQLESKGVIRRKKMPDGSIRIYDVIEGYVPCCGTVEQWLQCPENDCALSSGIERCPHFKDIVNHRNYTQTIIVGLDINQKTRNTEQTNGENEEKKLK